MGLNTYVRGTDVGSNLSSLRNSNTTVQNVPVSPLVF